MRASVEKSATAWSQANWAGALAACTRPEGFLLLPWIIAGETRLEVQGRWKRIAGIFFLWAGPCFFLKDKFWTLLGAYREGIGLTEGPARVQLPFLNFIEHFFAYLSQPFYVFSPLVYWFAILGIGKMVRRKDAEGDALKRILLQVGLALLLSRLIPSGYQDRHMLPFLPLILMAACYHLETFLDHWGGNKNHWKAMLAKNGILTFCFVWLSLYSAAVLISQNDSFGDIKRSAEFLTSLPAGAVIYSDEIPKTQYWSGRKVRLMPYLTENTPFDPKPGDYVVLHSFYIPRLAMVDRHLIEVHDALILHDDQSMVVPLLTDVMEDPALQNRVASTAFRFQPQFFKSRVYQIRK